MNKKRLAVTLVLLITPGLLLAARPSINELNTRVNQLEADVNQLDSRVTTNESDINANSTLIDDNTNRINALRPSISVRANGTRIGTYLITNEDPSGGQPNQVTVMNDSEYIFSICLNSTACGDTKSEGDLMWPISESLIAYTTVDCTGQEYLLESQLELINGLGSLLKGSGYVFDTTGTIYYLPINSQPIEDKGSVTVRSVRAIVGSPSVCNPPGTIPRRLLYPVFPNDSAVTGVSTSSFALPLSLGF